jgi:hypothetical protein
VAALRNSTSWALLGKPQSYRKILAFLRPNGASASGLRKAKFFTDCNLVNMGEAELQRLFKRVFGFDDELSVWF